MFAANYKGDPNADVYTGGPGARRPAAPDPGPPNPMEVVYQQLRQRYPNIPDQDLREGAQRLVVRMQQQQSEEFYSQLFPERDPRGGLKERPMTQPVPGVPNQMATPYPPPEVQKQMVAPGQEQFARQQAQMQAKMQPPAGPVGQAQPVMPPSQGTPYNPSAPAEENIRALAKKMPAY